MGILFISGSNTAVGKTYITLQLMEQLGKRGLKVVGAKPIETGISHLPKGKRDGELILKLSNRLNPTLYLQLEQISPYRFPLPASPIVAVERVGQQIEIPKILQSCRQLEQLVDLVIVEGAGGLLVPIKKGYFMADLAQELGGRVLIVLTDQLGVINSYHLNQLALEKWGLKGKFVVNLMGKENEFRQISYPYLKNFPIWIWQWESKKVVDWILETLK